MKLISLFLLLLLACWATDLSACPVCKKQQPKLLKGIAHGAGPKGKMDMIPVWIVAGITAVTSVYAVRWLLVPGEKETFHIKNQILNHGNTKPTN